jgi:alanyl-tRNA synthetase
MPAKRIYYDDAFEREFTAEVLRCERAKANGGADAVIGDKENSGAELWRVTLDRTAFYPSSGGQPNDTGQLGEARVLDVMDEDEEVIHVVDRHIEAGPVSGRIDWERRFDHMQQHSAQHLLSAVFHEKFALPTVSFHLGAKLCSIDLRGREPTQEILDVAADAVNALVYEDRAVKVRYGTAEELAAEGVRKTVERAGVLRAIEIEGVELQPCGGTHVRSTGQIGMILLRGVSRIRQDWRVEFACGKRAERLAREDYATVRAVAQRLNCAAQETVAAAERVVQERDAHFKSARASLEKLAEAEARAAVQATEAGGDGVRVVTRVFHGVEPEYAQCFAREVGKAGKAVALVARAECGSIFFSQHASAGQDMNALLAETLKEIGGKGGGSRDVARGRLAEAGRAQEFVNRAAAILREKRDAKLQGD